MPSLKIKGESKLHGTINISGAKNAALKILPAAILADSPSVIQYIPKISDVSRMIEILRSLGAIVTETDNCVEIDPRSINTCKPDPVLVKKLRASIVVAGPLLARFGKAELSEPGGCLIGARPIDDHLDVFRQLGVKIRQTDESYHLNGQPKAAEVILNKMSVTATENAILASVFTKGKTVIRMAAAEPEISDLAGYLNAMGAKINGAGTHDIEITGVSSLHGCQYRIMPDRIEAGTYLLAAIATNSEITIGPVVPEHLAIVLKKINDAGARVSIVLKNGKQYFKTRKHVGLKPINIDTRTYPGFPTDLQSPMVVLMTQAEGESRVFETIFEGRFLYLRELEKMKAKFELLSPHMLHISGPCKLKAKEIICEDIRGGAALIIAALIAKGETTIRHAGLIDRGYENIDGKLQQAGAEITRIE